MTIENTSALEVARGYIERVRANCPPELLAERAWLRWRYVQESGKPKPRKVPFYVNGKPRGAGLVLDSPADREQLTTFEEAAADCEPGTFLGIALGPIGNKRLCGIDCDDITPDHPAVAQVLAAGDTYAETSPSGKGLKLFGLGDIGTTKASEQHLEIYSGQRFFAVTGAALNGCRRLNDLTAAAALARKLFLKAESTPTAAVTNPVTEGRHNYLLKVAGRMRRAGMEQEEILAALRVHNGAHCSPPRPDKELQDLAKFVASKPPLDDAEEAGAFPPELVLQAGAFLDLPLPEREPLIETLLFKQSIVELYGPRGSMKTWTAMAMAVAITTGTPFAAWSVPAARGVLYVDGEMSGRDFQERWRAMLRGHRPAALHIMPSELFFRAFDVGLVINHPGQQARFRATLLALRPAPDLIIFDNLSSLTLGLEENDNTQQEQVLGFFRALRHMGYAVLFVHHTGKSGDQRGASRREDWLDLVIRLEPPEDYCYPPRAALSFAKIRGKQPQPFGATVTLQPDAMDHLQLCTLGEPLKRAPQIERKHRVLRHCALISPESRRKIADAMDESLTNIRRDVDALIREDLLSEKLRPTDKGLGKLRRLWPDLDIPL